MSIEEIETKLQQEREKTRSNSSRILKFLGYEKDTSKYTQEQLDARIEILMEKKQNKTGDPTTPTPQLFQGIDEERENVDAASSVPPALSFEELTSDYDALSALIPMLRNNSSVNKYQNNPGVRILRLPASIQLDKNHSIIRRVVL